MTSAWQSSSDTVSLMFVLVSDDNVIAEINLVIFSSIVLNLASIFCSKFGCPVELPLFTLFVVGLEMQIIHQIFVHF